VKTVSGIVTSNSDGLPLPGVNVIEKGTSNGVQTDFDGRYSLQTSSGNTLVYSYVGMETEELPIHSSIMNVALNDGELLDEVVVSGYSTALSNSKSHSTSSIQSKEIVKSLYGQASGISIRGASSLPSKNNVLYIVDGVPVKNNAAKNIDPNSIEFIEILKDAQATSIYGSRASNGVVVINTKNHELKNRNELGVTVAKGITNTRFEIEKPYTITNNGDVTVIDIDRFEVPAKYDYFVAPVLNENVFLTAKIGNWEGYNLLPAEANIYFEGSYSGKTNINPGATTDSLTISLGIDPNIIVKRTQRNDFKKTTFIGNNKVVYKAFDIEIRNNKTTDIQLTLKDRIPITQNRAIKLDDIDTGTSNYDKEKGLLKWIISLKTGNTDKVSFSYAIKHPQGKRINL
jgi:TonB-dependent SusC/RagA subfamily outer membrane receptor